MTYLTAEGKSTIYSSEESLAQAFIRYTNLELKDIRRSFIKIGFRLVEANKSKYYEELGYQSIEELAEKEFGFKSTVTYNLMQIWRFAHDKDCPMNIDERFDKYNQTQLLEMSRSKHDFDNYRLAAIVPEKATKEEVRKIIKEWNRWTSVSAISNEEIRQVLKAPPLLDEETEDKEPQEEIFHLGGKTEAEPRDKDELKDSGNLEESESEQERWAAWRATMRSLHGENALPMTDDELIKQSIKLGNGVYNGKFDIVEYYHSNPTQAEFVKFVQEQYCDSGSRCAYIEVNRKTFTIHRESGGKIVLPWTVVAGNISRLITADEYLNEDEKEHYLQWKAEKEKVTVSSEPSEKLDEPDEEFFAYAKNHSTTGLSPRRQQTNREYLATLPDDELINKLLVKILNVYPFRGESSKFLSMTRSKLIEWLNAPHKVTE
ncbi:MAG: hypothetical protein K2I30_05615 [Clostridia bacterium]|nr:hypothetical protein [Clostridia bacterium]